MAERLGAYGKVNVVAAPAIGGLIIGHEVARHLGARFIFTERDASGAMVLRRGFTVEPGEAAVVVEDVVTTGGSSREVIEVLSAAGATVLAAGSIIDRSGGHVELGVPRVALATLKVIAYPPENCPLCQQGIPVEKPGSRPGHEAHPASRSPTMAPTSTAGRSSPALPTIQGTLETILCGIEGRAVQVAGPAAPTPGSTLWPRWRRSRLTIRSRSTICGRLSIGCCRAPSASGRRRGRTPSSIRATTPRQDLRISHLSGGDLPAVRSAATCIITLIRWMKRP